MIPVEKAWSFVYNKGEIPDKNRTGAGEKGSDCDGKGMPGAAARADPGRGCASHTGGAGQPSAAAERNMKAARRTGEGGAYVKEFVRTAARMVLTNFFCLIFKAKLCFTGSPPGMCRRLRMLRRDDIIGRKSPKRRDAAGGKRGEALCARKTGRECNGLRTGCVCSQRQSGGQVSLPVRLPLTRT